MIFSLSKFYDNGFNKCDHIYNANGIE